MDKRQDQQEVRRVAYGSTYWLRRTGLCNDQWHITADGVSICSPTTYERAMQGFDAVTGR